jgi:anti-sigma factor RsiW
MTKPSFRDVELLSVYLDGALGQTEATRIESRLLADPDLATVMDDLRAARSALRKLRSRRAPRNFTLSRQMAGVKPPLPRTYPVFRYASAFATLLLFFTFAVNFLASQVSYSAPYGPAFGMGGGGGGPQEPSAEMAPQATLDAADATRIAGDDVQQVAPQGYAGSTGVRPSVAPVPVNWQLGLLVTAVVMAGVAWLLRSMRDQRWRAS